MKTKTIILTIFILTSCETAQFEVPQPDGRKNEKMIAGKLFGYYASLIDSSKLIVSPQHIIRISTFELAALKSELDSAMQPIFTHDTTFSLIESGMDNRSKTKDVIIVKGDSVFKYTVYNDTLFNVSRGDIIRKFKGYYFLNRQTLNTNWDVMKLTKTKRGLTLGRVSTAEEIESLREVTGSTSDSVYNFNPTKRQFNRFVKEKGFSKEAYYVKID